MGTGGNTYDKYKHKRAMDGKLCLNDPVADNICRLIAEGEDDEQIIALTSTTQELINDIRTQPLANRRITHLKKLVAKEAYEPSTADECLAYVKSRLVAIDKGETDTKEKIAALTELADIAMKERSSKPVQAPVVMNDSIKALIGGN